ncbi:MAG: hypothetical protein ACI9P5_002893 [Saprospiraceae bacterium]|jgi:hypothetical protein
MIHICSLVLDLPMNKIVKIYGDAFDGITKGIWIFSSVILINWLGKLILPSSRFIASSSMDRAN